tara:strand:- start:324 stop:965 length:642 start_codon:yes stop_codon:yes gene_type:complete
MKLNKYLIGEILSLLAFSVFTIIAIKNEQISMFYLVYLFWMDEFLKTIFNFLNYFFNRSNIPNPLVYNKMAKSRLFMLSIYFVFIIVFFGFIIDWKSSDTVLGNFGVFFFKNAFFNLSVTIFLLREIYEFYYGLRNIQNSPYTIFSKGVITLHLSLLLGIFTWAFFNGKFGDFNLDIGSYKTIVAIIPFIIIKLIFEIMEIKQRAPKSLDNIH